MVSTWRNSESVNRSSDASRDNQLTDLKSVVDITNNAIESRNDVDLGLFGNDFALNLVTHGRHSLLRGSDKGDSDLVQGFNKTGILGQESITRMNSLSAGVLDGFDNVWNVEVTLRGGSRTL